MATFVSSCALPTRRHPAIVVALALSVIVAPPTANGNDHAISGAEAQAASEVLPSRSSARAAAAQAAVEESSDWREILPGLTGNEPDITVRLPAGPVGLEVGYGRFFGGAYLRDADFALEMADFFYLQTMVGF